MPALDLNVLDCVFYLYPTLEAAKAGEPTGGTGFFVGIESELVTLGHHLYAITNRHCIVESGPSVVLRVNRLDGQPHYVESKAAAWSHHWDLSDVAALSVALTSDHQFNFVSSRLFFVTPKLISERGIGPGEDAFMVGRFIGQDGKQRNLPTSRFGNISRMNGDPITDKYGIKQDSFLVEMRSMPGYSGSPVFTYINPTLARAPHYWTPINVPYSQKLHGPWLLGIDWCHLDARRPVRREEQGKLVDTGTFVETNSGMAGVIPAWKIQEVLDQPEFVVERKEEDERIASENR